MSAEEKKIAESIAEAVNIMCEQGEDTDLAFFKGYAMGVADRKRPEEAEEKEVNGEDA